MISADVTFFKSTPYYKKKTFKSTLLEPEDNFMFFLENSLCSYVNVDHMPTRYGQVYTKRVKSTTDVSGVLVSSITDMISVIVL